LNFLRQHFEKLGLGFVLTVLVASIVLVMFSMGKARGEATEQKEAAEAALKAGKDIEAAANPTIEELIEALWSEKNVFDCIGAEGKPGGSLLAPVGYMSCVSPKCIYLIDHDARRCPFCRAEQPPEKKDSFPLAEDADRDGIPNYVEDNTFFLDSKDPKDARLDVDGDGFTNVEEYRADRNMASGASCPPLANNLRIMGKPSHMSMPIAVQRVLTSGEDDPQKWRVIIAVKVSSRARPVTGRFGIGKVIGRFAYRGQRYGPFKVDKIETKSRTVEGETKDVHVVTISSEGKTYEAAEGKNFPETELSAKLVFLGTRLKKQREIIEKKMWIVGKKDHPFQLTNYAVNRSERYKIKAFTEDMVVVELQQGRGDGTMEGDGGMRMEGGGPGAGNMRGDGMDMERGGGEGGMRPGGGGLVPSVPEKEPEPVVFTITMKYDAERDLLDEPPRPARRPGAPRGVPGQGRR